MDEPQTAPDLLTMEAAAQVLGITPEELMGLVDDGILAPAPQSSEELVFVADEVAAVAQQQR
jgi:hypothetical protein